MPHPTPAQQARLDRIRTRLLAHLELDADQVTELSVDWPDKPRTLDGTRPTHAVISCRVVRRIRADELEHVLLTADEPTGTTVDRCSLHHTGPRCADPLAHVTSWCPGGGHAGRHTDCTTPGTHDPHHLEP